MDIKTPTGEAIYCLPDDAICEAADPPTSPENIMECPCRMFDPYGCVCIPDLCDHYKEGD